MTETKPPQTLAERLYALLAYTSATTILSVGGFVASRIAEGEISAAPWQFVLIAMIVPLLAATMVSCGNHHENPYVRAITWILIAPLGSINPLAWLGSFILILVMHLDTIRQHVTDG